MVQVYQSISLVFQHLRLMFLASLLLKSNHLIYTKSIWVLSSEGSRIMLPMRNELDLLESMALKAPLIQWESTPIQVSLRHWEHISSR